MMNSPKHTTPNKYVRIMLKANENTIGQKCQIFCSNNICVELTHTHTHTNTYEEWKFIDCTHKSHLVLNTKKSAHKRLRDKKTK